MRKVIGLPHRVWGGVLQLTMVILAVSCGKKEPPPSPDRWPPKLVSVKAVDKLHVSCYFNEELDRASAERRENYAIRGPRESLEVIAASLDRGGVEVNLATSSQEEVQYSLLLKGVRDLAGNQIREGSEESFKGSLRPDTLPPRVVSEYPRHLDARVPTDTSLSLSFSEPMDTATVSPILLPSDFELSTAWNASRSRVMMDLGSSGRDTLRESHTYNLFLLAAGRDLGGNRLKKMLRVTFSTGDSLPRGSLAGTVSRRGADPRGAIVLLLAGNVWETADPVSLTQVEDSSGAYVLSNLPSGRYFLVSAHRTGGKMWIGGYQMHPPGFLPRSIELAPDGSAEEMDIVLYPESERPLDTLTRFYHLLNEFLEQ